MTEYPKLMALLPFASGEAKGPGPLCREQYEDWPIDRLLWHDCFGRGVAHKDFLSSATSKLYSYLKRRRLRKIRRFTDWLIEPIEHILMLKDILWRIDQFKPDILLLYSEPALFKLYQAVIAKTGLPYHMTIHDGMTEESDICGMSSMPAKERHSRFAVIYRGASSRDVISASMAADYEKRFGVSAIVVTRSIREDRVKNSNRVLREPVQLVMAGTAWVASELGQDAPDPLKGFISQLSEAEKPYVLEICDGTVGSKPPVLIDHAFLPNDEFTALMARAHIGYAYDPFSDAGRQFAKGSFPSKIMQCIIQGLPFLYQGPKNSTVGEFLKEYDAGVVVEATDGPALIEGLRQIEHDYDKMQQECRRAALTLFNRNRINQAFYDNVMAGIERHRQQKG